MKINEKFFEEFFFWNLLEEWLNSSLLKKYSNKNLYKNYFHIYKIKEILIWNIEIILTKIDA